MNKQREQMNVVIVGHVDHGKSTVVGRLLADTNALPKGKLEAVRAMCERNSKPFEYAFLLDALKDEQSQGITIDTARCFFKSEKRDYIIIDAPGHIEFLKNMITGAARAEAAMLIIDANEGIKENSKRHGYMMSFLGIRNINVCVNKMDLVKYDEKVFTKIKEEFTKFLAEINIKAMNFIPISAREGDNIASLSSRMPWYKGNSILSALDHLEKEPLKVEKPFRYPLQDIYKFTQQNDERRIFAGRVETGTVHVGDEVIFFPSHKTSRVKSIEGFNLDPQEQAFAGQSTGFTLETQIYVRPGEMICKQNEIHPHVSTKFKANIFWMGKLPLVKGKNYKLKIATQQVPVVLSEIISVLDASELSSIANKAQVDRHDVAECVFETLKPVAFDDIVHIPETGRFVIVDNYEIAGGGIILSPVYQEDSVINQYIKSREFNWIRGDITSTERAAKFDHKSALVIITGEADQGKLQLAKKLEEKLFQLKKNVYFLGISNEVLQQNSDEKNKTLAKISYVRQLGEMAHVLTDAGLILITSISDVDTYELEMLKSLSRPSGTIIINIGQSQIDTTKADLHFENVERLDKIIDSIVNKLNKDLQPDPEYTI